MTLNVSSTFANVSKQNSRCFVVLKVALCFQMCSAHSGRTPGSSSKDAEMEAGLARHRSHHQVAAGPLPL